MHEDCARARRLIEAEAIEGVVAEDGAPTAEHTSQCPECAAFAEATGNAIRVVRTARAPLPADLAFRTQFRVSLRAREMRAAERHWPLWIWLALSWATGMATAPWVWRGFEWIGRSAGLPDIGVRVAFGMWWAAPAAIAGAMWVVEKRTMEEE